jgi:hypothetical protein
MSGIAVAGIVSGKSDHVPALARAGREGTPMLRVTIVI